MKRINEELKEITLYETPETDEALFLLLKKKKELRWMKIVALISIVLAIYTYSMTFSFYSIFFLNFIPLPIAITLICVYKAIIRPYKTLYRIAVHNDQVRNDEHIRFKERQRLERENASKKPLTEKLIDHSVENIGLKEIDNKTLNKQIKNDKKFMPPKKGDNVWQMKK